MNSLKKYGVGGLTADSKTRFSYGLKEENCRIVSNGSTVEVDGMGYLKTDIRLEKYQPFNKLKTNTLVVFTHENQNISSSVRS